MNMWKNAHRWAHDTARRFGFDVVRYRATSHALARRAALLDAHQVDLVIDVGANDGEYASELRRIGYWGRIFSIEPLADAVEKLEIRLQRDPAWECLNVALGDYDGVATINVSNNSVSSSMLDMLPIHERAASDSRVISRRQVPIRRLDTIESQVIGEASRPFLKIDVQGHELAVLDGAASCLDRIVGIQIELSVEPLYAGAPGLITVLQYVTDRNFLLMSVEAGFSDPTTGRLLQFDGIFFRPSLGDAGE